MLDKYLRGGGERDAQLQDKIKEEGRELRDGGNCIAGRDLSRVIFDFAAGIQFPLCLENRRSLGTAGAKR